MNVEIDHGDAGEPVHLARPQRAYRSIVEEAKPHRPLRLGMMARGPDRAKRIVSLVCEDRINRGDDRAGGAQRGFSRCSRQHRIGIDRDMAGFWDRAENPVDMPPGVDTQQILAGCFRRLAALQPGEFRIVERLQHRPQPGRRFRVVPAGVMVETGWVGIKECRHRKILEAGSSVAHPL
jgi:hypothetical protein